MDLPTPPLEHQSMVLLVDDQAMVGEAIRRALQGQADMDFHYCSDPAAAAATAERLAPTVILQDLIMPGVDGLALVREYRARPATRNTPIIVLSTREEPTIKRDSFAAGANDYLVKLPDTIELLARVRYHTQAFLHRQQRDDAYRALRQSQQDLLEANLELQRLMNADVLTCLNNRRRFDDYAAAEWRRAVREQSLFALLLVDVDEFKRYNDSYGHLSGDEALKRIAEAILSSCARPADLAARFGGEEFAVVLPSTSLEGAEHVAEIIHRSVRGLALPHASSSVQPYVTVSIGVAACTPRAHPGLADLLEHADQALYAAKNAGRNRTIARTLS
ncbi:MAG TPA: diguanylate cyclase [Gammaproteobacteria bacterium]|nr:diguanylate cyclase [Gammaproteobacteria bacterium]